MVKERMLEATVSLWVAHLDDNMIDTVRYKYFNEVMHPEHY